MKTKAIFWTLFLLMQISIQAQHSFEILHSTPVNEVIVDLLEEDSGDFLAVGYEGETWKPWEYKGLIIRISPQGDTVIRRYSIADTVFKFQRIVKSEDGGYFVFGIAAYPPEYKQKLLIAKLNADLEIIWYKWHELDVKSIYLKRILLISNEGGFYVISEAYKKYTTTTFSMLLLCRINEDGELDNSKLFPEFGYGQRIGDAVYSKDCYGISVFATGINGSSHCTHLIFDTDFSLKNSKIFPDYIDTYINVKWFTDSTLIFTANCWYFDPNPQHDDVGIAETDTSFANMNFKKYGSIDTVNYPAVVQTMDFVSNDSVCLVGTHNVIFDQFPHGISWISVWQLDAELNARSEAFFGGDAYYNAYNILSTSDGGCLVAATRYDYLTQQEDEFDIFILKLKREDLITSIAVSAEMEEEAVFIYPNPGKDKLILNTGIENALFCLYDMQGQLIFKTRTKSGNTIINCARLLPGTYLYTLHREDVLQKSGKWLKL
jgi:Secretion system C-terminal sorting domain